MRLPLGRLVVFWVASLVGGGGNNCLGLLPLTETFQWIQGRKNINKRMTPPLWREY